MKNITITMPHRHTVRYEDDETVAEYNVELLTDGIVLYRNNRIWVSGKETGDSSEAEEVENWLRSKFDVVEVDNAPPIDTEVFWRNISKNKK